MSQDPHDQLLLQIRGAVAEYERTLLTERMQRGKQTKYREGALLEGLLSFMVGAVYIPPISNGEELLWILWKKQKGCASKWSGRE
jgi:hypothetical protein